MSGTDLVESSKAVIILTEISKDLTVTGTFLAEHVHHPISELTGVLEKLDDYLGRADKLTTAVDMILKFVNIALKIGGRFARAAPQPISTILSAIIEIIKDLRITDILRKGLGEVKSIVHRVIHLSIFRRQSPKSVNTLRPETLKLNRELATDQDGLYGQGQKGRQDCSGQG